MAFLVPGEWHQGLCLSMSWPNCLSLSLEMPLRLMPTVIPLSSDDVKEPVADVVDALPSCPWTHSYILQAFLVNPVKDSGHGGIFRTQRRQDGVYTLVRSFQSMSWWINTPAFSPPGWDNSGIFYKISLRSAAGLSSNRVPAEVTCLIIHLVLVSLLSLFRFLILSSELLGLIFK